MAMKILLAVFVLIIAVLTVLAKQQGTDWSNLTRIMIGFVIIGAILGCIVSIKDIIKENRKEKIAAQNGEIKGNAVYPNIDIAGTGSILRVEGSGDVPLPEGCRLRIRLIDSNLNISTVLHDTTGQPLAAIEDNVWTLYNNNYEYNNDQNAFELVTKGERRIFFQVNYRNGAASVTGLLLNNKGEGVYFSKAPSPLNGGVLYQIRKNQPIAFDKIPTAMPLFKYPRTMYLGKRRK
jgi:hypothetical protein